MTRQDLSPEAELMRLRRRLWVGLAVATVSLVAAEIVQPAPVAYLAVCAVIGVFQGLLSMAPSPVSSWASTLTTMGFVIVALREPDSWFAMWWGLSAFMLAMTAVQLLGARRIVKRQQREHRPEPTGATADSR